MKISDEEVVDGYAAAVGARLRTVRKQKKLSLQSVEAMSDQEFKASVLGAYERGERSISVPRLQRLAALYDVSIEQLLPKDQLPTSLNGVGFDEFVATEVVLDPIATSELPSRRTQSDTKFTIDLNKLNEVAGPERDVLRRYLGMIQVQRQDFNGRMITIRTDDLRVIGCIFELTLEQMSQRLDDLGLRLR